MHAPDPRLPETMILPLRTGAGPARPTWISARRIVDAAVSGADVAVTVDVPDGHVIHSDPGLLGAMLADLVGRACRATGAAVGVGRPEVVVTSVLLPDAIELEVADSGPVPSATDHAWLEQQAHAARRLGGTLDVRPCPEGGTAVTLRFPRRLTARRAA
jgi:signal transduction histidine kinase